MRADSWAQAWRTAETPTASTVHEPVGKPGGPGLWHHKGLQLPPYIQHVANDLRGQGHDESEAVEMAVGIVKNWAAGHDGHGRKVHPDVQAAAAKNIAQWEALKARASGGAKRFNPYHRPPGTLGGEFTSGGGAGSSSGASSKKPAAAARHPAKPAHQAPAHPATGAGGHKQALLRQAAADRARAHRLQAELHLVEAQIHTATASAKKTAAKAKTAGHTVKHHTAAVKKTTTHHAAAATKHAATVASLQQRATTLRTEIHDLLHKARALDAQAAAMRSGGFGGWQAVWARTWAPGSTTGTGSEASSG